MILNISGQGVMPEFKISHQCFQFGECPVNDHRDIQFTLENLGIQQLEIAAARNCYFAVNPNQAVVPVNSKISFVATFNPRSAGIYLFYQEISKARLLFKFLVIIRFLSNYMELQARSVKKYSKREELNVQKLISLKILILLNRATMKFTKGKKIIVNNKLIVRLKIKIH